MTIKLIAVGKTDQKELQHLIDVYISRLKHYVSFEINIIPDIRHSKNLSESQQKSKEAAQKSAQEAAQKSQEAVEKSLI